MGTYLAETRQNPDYRQIRKSVNFTSIINVDLQEHDLVSISFCWSLDVYTLS